jgi:hypothetical protein
VNDCNITYAGLNKASCWTKNEKSERNPLRHKGIQNGGAEFFLHGTHVLEPIQAVPLAAAASELPLFTDHRSPITGPCRPALLPSTL